MTDFLDNKQIHNFIEEYLNHQETSLDTQALIDSGAVPRLKNYIVKPGKVSDSIFGGKGSFIDKKSGKKVEFENPPLKSKTGRDLRIMIRSPRISTHDFNRGEIPFKDQILALNHNFMRKLLKPYIGSSQLEIPELEDSSLVIVAENLEQLGFENVLRAYNARSSTSTSLFQNYINGAKTFCGHPLPNNLKINGPLPYVMDTPTTKSDDHDLVITPEELFSSGACTANQYKQAINGALVAFGVVTNFLNSKGLIAVDTKTEHGVNSLGQVVAQDEIWTIDSSRFWLMDDYQKQTELLSKGESLLVEYLKATQPGLSEKDYTFDGKIHVCPRSYSKEFARGFSKGEDLYGIEEQIQIAVRYIESIQFLLGQKFTPDLSPRNERIIKHLNQITDLFDI